MLIDELWLLETYRLRGLNRYNDRILIKGEDVSQHCFFTTLIVMKLREVIRFNLAIALPMALLHDQPEMYCSDVSHKVKIDHPEIAVAIKIAEAKIWQTKFPEGWARLAATLELGISLEAKVVLLADAISVYQFSLCELNLGNKTIEMSDIVMHTKQRIETLESDIAKTLLKQRPRHLMTEGLDCSGKDTFVGKLRELYPFWEKYNYLSSRGPLSCLVYNELYLRGTDPEEYWRMLGEHSLIVFMSCPVPLIRQRMLDSGHELISADLLQKTKVLYERYLAEATRRGIEVYVVDGLVELEQSVNKFFNSPVGQSAYVDFSSQA